MSGSHQGTVKAPKGTESTRNSTEAKGCIFRSYSDMTAVNNMCSFKIYIKGVRVSQQIFQSWSQQKRNKHRKELLLESRCVHFLFWGGEGAENVFNLIYLSVKITNHGTKRNTEVSFTVHCLQHSACTEEIINSSQVCP